MSSSSEVNEFAGIILESLNTPLVRVPVLSKTIFLTLTSSHRSKVKRGRIFYIPLRALIRY